MSLHLQAWDGCSRRTSCRFSCADKFRRRARHSRTRGAHPKREGTVQPRRSHNFNLRTVGSVSQSQRDLNQAGRSTLWKRREINIRRSPTRVRGRVYLALGVHVVDFRRMTLRGIPPDAPRSCSRCFIIGVSLIVAGSSAHGDLAMETETARVLSPGRVEVGTAFEFQTSPAGEEYALPMAIEFGVLPRLEALIEPVALPSSQPTSQLTH